MEYCSSLCTFGSVYFVFLDHTEICLFSIHLCFFVDPPPVNGILLFPLHVWVRLRFFNGFFFLTIIFVFS